VLKTLIFLNKLDDGFLFLIEGLRVRGREVSVFLIQDAVYLAVRGNKHSEAVQRAVERGVSFHLLERDVNVRGILDHLLPGVELVDYDGLVDILFSEDQTVVNL